MSPHYTIEARIAAEGTAKVVVFAASPSEAEAKVEQYGLDACELLDPEEFLHNADIDVDYLESDAEEVSR